MAIFYSPRRKETIPPKFHLIPPKFYFVPTWVFFCLPRGYLRFATWIFVFPESKASCVVSAEVKTYKKILAPLSCLLGEARIVVMLDEGVTSAPHRGAHHPRGRGW